MKQIFAFLFFLFCGVAHSAQVVNVEYIHNAIKQKWDITIPYNPELTNPHVVANMKYLLTAVDVTNEMLGTNTNYGNGEYATLVAADTIATDTAVDVLVDPKYKFFITTTSNTNVFNFTISAAGTFYVDWGDGQEEIIHKPDVGKTEYSHQYKSAGTWNIKLGGRAVAYSGEEKIAAISFYNNANLAEIDGSLGRIFSTLANGHQPVFFETFMWCVNLAGQIPPALFTGIRGAPVEYMFGFLFYRCRNLSGEIPENLFAGLDGSPVTELFHATFYGTNLTGEIPGKLFAGIRGKPAKGVFGSTFQNSTGFTTVPAELFAGISGAPAPYMFSSTFMNCTGLTEVADKLFANISGAPAEYMFYASFLECNNLKNIPENLFGNISGTAQDYMFAKTFYNCTSLTGKSAQINGKYLYNIWPNATEDQIGEMYYNAIGLDDYNGIPELWK